MRFKRSRKAQSHLAPERSRRHNRSRRPEAWTGYCADGKPENMETDSVLRGMATASVGVPQTILSPEN